jgi:hypothetical protein
MRFGTIVLSEFTYGHLNTLIKKLNEILYHITGQLFFRKVFPSQFIEIQAVKAILFKVMLPITHALSLVGHKMA